MFLVKEMRMYFDVEFEDEAEMSNGNEYVPVLLYVSGEVNGGDDVVSNVKMKAIYSMEDEDRRIRLSEISNSDLKRLVDKAKDKIMEEYKETYNDMVNSSYDDNVFYDTAYVEEEEAKNHVRTVSAANKGR
jgi:hypothetical protein